MTEDEAYAILHRAFGLTDALRRYRDLKPLDGLRESLENWDRFQAMQDRGQGDPWDVENNKTLAYVMMGMFCWRLLGHVDYPDLPQAGPDVMRDSHAHLCLWSRSIILDHVHSWTTCHHSGKSSPHPACRLSGGFRGSHIICAVCSEERFDPQPMVDRARTMLTEREAAA